ncbi:uncharacterized protein LOC129767649 [Toxorhynchites rutilus septentrionalis]|uniref:uncharacterized protein LOC129767649 n=1 Tax=Toxorhynchites rutilus septentrionalis TaxID=329112 RepID=UPI0024798BFD|nr:uncharacterized protein LOC129767649 [Toxorhynchites rutilus septentrionalis]
MMVILLLSILIASVAAVRDPRCKVYDEGDKSITLPHRDDCTKFHTCDVQGNALEMKCPPSTYFSADLGVCTFDRSGCAATNSDDSKHHNLSSENCPNLPHGTTFPKADDCSSYIVCLKGEAHIIQCPKGLFFDRNSNKCKLKRDVECTISLEIAPPAPILPLPNVPLVPASPELLNPGLPAAPVPPLTESLVDASENTVRNPDTVIIPQDPRCQQQQYDPESPIMLNHANDCTKYIVCVGDFAVEKQCPEGQHWSADNNWCDYASRAKCMLL